MRSSLPVTLIEQVSWALFCAHLLVEAGTAMQEVEEGGCFGREQEKTSFCVALRSPPKEM